MTENQRNIVTKFLLWCLGLSIVIFIGVNNVFADTISNYGTRYYWGVANDTSVLNDTGYRYNDLNKVTLYSGSAPTYADSETFNGFYNQINYSIVSGSIYSLTLRVSYSNLSTTEFGSDNVNNRLLNKDFAHCSDCNITSVSGSIRRYNSSAPVANNLYDYVVTVTYTFVANSTVNQWYIGSYTGDDRTMGVYEHQYTSIVMVTDLDINENNSSTIINQNQTIIDQNQTIIDQNNQNTQDIINNNNTNTDNIINNQNSNTQQQIESQKVCNTFYINNSNVIPDNVGRYLNSSGVVSIGWGQLAITDYIELSNSSTIKALSIDTERPQAHYCFYDGNKTLISCYPNSELVLNDYLDIPNNSKYVRFTIVKSLNIPTFEISNCKNGNQALNDSIEEQTKTSKGILGKIGDLFDNLFSNDDADISGLDNMVGWLPPGPVDSIINLPLSLFNSLTNTLSGTCSPVTLTLPFVNQNLTLPCFDAYMSQYITGFNTLWTWVGVTVSIFILYGYLLNLYKWIDDTLTMRENNLPGYYDDNMWGGA